MEPYPTPATALSGVLVVLLVDYLALHRAWGWLRLAQGAAFTRDTPGLLFSKVMGSGHNGGFSLRPSSTHQGLIGLFETQQQAEAFAQGPLVESIRSRARESWLGLMSVASARGEWDRQAWLETPAKALQQPGSETGPMAVLTRASIRPAKAMSFWRHAPASQASLSQAPGCLLAMGLGEAPLIRQCTFSLWSDTPAMLEFAHHGAHQQAIAAAYKHGFFTESLFLRLRVLRMQGQWQGQHFAPEQEPAHV